MEITQKEFADAKLVGKHIIRLYVISIVALAGVGYLLYRNGVFGNLDKRFATTTIAKTENDKPIEGQKQY